MSGLIALIVEFLASVAAAAKARQQARAAEELPRGAEEIKVIEGSVATIRAELAKLTEPPMPPKPEPKPEQPVKLPN
jgi:hypothetical protein